MVAAILISLTAHRVAQFTNFHFLYRRPRMPFDGIATRIGEWAALVRNKIDRVATIGSTADLVRRG